MEDKFNAENWIFVGDVDICEHSKKQVQICKDLNLPIKGAILCNEPEHAKSEACQKVPAFPSFCNLKSNVCIAGLRDNMEQFHHLEKMSNQQLKK
jgi:hypothetical protein